MYQGFKGLLLGAVLYPLQRIQSIQQIQNSYSNPTIKSSISIVGQAVHYGRKSYFRGFMPFISKSALVTAAVRSAEVGQGESKIWGYRDWISIGLGLVGYGMLYPLQIINLHMSVEVQHQRFYSNVRECVSKIKRNEGIKTLYRGFFYSCSLFTVQLASIRYVQRRLQPESRAFSQLERIGMLFGLMFASQLVLYPFSTIKKLFQINGAMGHTDMNFSLVQAFKGNRFAALFKGFSTRLSNISLFALLYCWMVGSDSAE